MDQFDLSFAARKVKTSLTKDKPESQMIEGVFYHQFVVLSKVEVDIIKEWVKVFSAQFGRSMPVSKLMAHFNDKVECLAVCYLASSGRVNNDSDEPVAKIRQRHSNSIIEFRP